MRRRRISTPPVVNRARQMTAPQPDRDMPQAMKPAVTMQNYLSQQPGIGTRVPYGAPSLPPPEQTKGVQMSSTPPLQQQAQMTPVQPPKPEYTGGLVTPPRPPVASVPVPPPPNWNPEPNSQAAMNGITPVQQGQGGFFLGNDGNWYSPQGWVSQYSVGPEYAAYPNADDQFYGQGAVPVQPAPAPQAPQPPPGPGWNPGMPTKPPEMVSAPPLQQQASMGPVQPDPVQAHQQVGNMVGQIPQQQAQMAPVKNVMMTEPPVNIRAASGWPQGNEVPTPSTPPGSFPQPSPNLPQPSQPPPNFPTPSPELPTPTPPPVGPPGVGPQVGGLPLSPQAEAVRRTLEDELSRELAAVGVQRSQLPAMLNLITARLQSDLDEELRLTDESANARGVFNSGIRTNSRKRVNDAASRQKQDIATDFASRYSDLANRESGAYGNFNRAWAEALLSLANDMAQDPYAPVGGSDNETRNQDQRDGNWTQPSRNRRNRKPRKNRKGGKGGN